MSIDFVKNRIGASSIAEAVRQQKQLSYFTTSSVQKDITQEYMDTWAERKYRSNDDFLNWVKTVFRTDNFLSFYKFLRQPVASAGLVNNIIKPQLSRVFFAEDSYFRYTIKGQEITEPDELKCEDVNDLLYNALLFRYNDVMVVDLEKANEPYRQLVCVKDIISIESENSIIYKIAYKGNIETEDGETIDGIVYIDDKHYIFYTKEYVALKTVAHDLKMCPADYIANEPFADDDVVRKSIFSFVREEFEEYVFLKTLQKMTEPNGAIPIVTQLKTKSNVDKSKDGKGISDKEPMSQFEIGGQKSTQQGEISSSQSLLQTGTIIEVPMVKKDDGSLDMDAVKNFINFFYIPTESLKYINDRVKEIKESILMSVLGDLSDQTNDRKNELQVKGGFVSAEDRIRSFANQLTRIRKRSDYKMLALKYGTGAFTNDAFYGSDFFIESQETLYSLFEKSPNPIERKNILVRLSKNRNRFNKERSQREVLMYDLMPYSADTDFDKAIEKGLIDKITFQLQSRFNFWIGIFEANYGDILIFWQNTIGTHQEKLLLLNNLLIDLIKEDAESKEQDPILKALLALPESVATIFATELNSSEIRGILGQTGAKTIVTTT